MYKEFLEVWFSIQKSHVCAGWRKMKWETSLGRYQKVTKFGTERKWHLLLERKSRGAQNQNYWRECVRLMLLRWWWWLSVLMRHRMCMCARAIWQLALLRCTLAAPRRALVSIARRMCEKWAETHARAHEYKITRLHAVVCVMTPRSLAPCTHHSKLRLELLF